LGAQVISHTSVVLCTRLTRRPGRNPRTSQRSATKCATAWSNSSRCARVSLARSRWNRDKAS